MKKDNVKTIFYLDNKNVLKTKEVLEKDTNLTIQTLKEHLNIFMNCEDVQLANVVWEENLLQDFLKDYDLIYNFFKQINKNEMRALSGYFVDILNNFQSEELLNFIKQKYLEFFGKDKIWQEEIETIYQFMNEGNILRINKLKSGEILDIKNLKDLFKNYKTSKTQKCYNEILKELTKNVYETMFYINRCDYDEICIYQDFICDLNKHFNNENLNKTLNDMLKR